LRGNREHRTTGLRQPARTFPLTVILHCQEQASPPALAQWGKSRYYVNKLCKDRLPRAAAPAEPARDRLKPSDRMGGANAVTAEWQQRILAYLVMTKAVDIEQRSSLYGNAWRARNSA
jgi:hypothetical protein